MRDILDPGDLWIGLPGTEDNQSNKPPVAVFDSLSVLQGSGPVNVDVLANDFDPEGGPLTLISAFAGLGSVVIEADDTVTYTPPPGISGFDTVVYEISDPLGQLRSGQIDVTITEPQLSIATLPDNTLTLTAETGLLDITLTQPSEFAGTYQVHTGDLVSGPINLVPPVITGTVTVGQTLTATPGLWIYDMSEGQPVTSWQWSRGGAEIAGETTDTYVVQPGDSLAGLSVSQIETSALGQRLASSLVAGGGFSPSDDLALQGWWDASDTATIYNTAGIVSGWADKAGGLPLDQSNTQRRPTTGVRSLAGQNVIDFDGSQFLERAETLPGSGDVAFHMALINDSTTSAFEALLAVEAVNDFQIDAGTASQFDGRFNSTGIATATDLSGGPFSGAMILSVVLDRTGAGTAQVFVANALRGSAAYTTSVDTAVTLIVMANRAKNAWFNGAVAEVIVTGDIGNRGLYHAYLASKWGIT